MIIYTVVGIIEHEGFDIIKSFTDEIKANEFALSCEKYDLQSLLSSNRGKLGDHPAGVDFTGGYTVEETELIGLIDITTSEDNTARFAVIDGGDK